MKVTNLFSDGVDKPCIEILLCANPCKKHTYRFVISDSDQKL